MPEVFDIKDQVTLLQGLFPFKFDKVIDFTENAKKDQRFKIQAGTLLQAKFRGHDLLIDTDKQFLQIQMATGGYWSSILTETEFQENKDVNLAFKSGNSYLCLLETKQTRHQVFVYVNSEPFGKRKDHSPCVLSENIEWRDFLQNEWKSNPTQFEKITVAKMLSLSKYFNGYGGYSISESLARLYIRCGIESQMTASEIFSDPSKLEILLQLPTLLDEELRDYRKFYNPLTLTRKQLLLKRKFRFEFLKWFRKTNFNSKKIFSFAIQTTEGWRTIWTPTIKVQTLLTLKRKFEDEEILDEICCTTKTKIKTASGREASKSAAYVQPCGEIWYLIKGQLLTPNSLGVGPHEWHSISAIHELEARGKVEQKGPSQTKGTGKNSKSSKKRSSKRAAKIRKLKFQSSVLN